MTAHIRDQGLQRKIPVGLAQFPSSGLLIELDFPTVVLEGWKDQVGSTSGCGAQGDEVGWELYEIGEHVGSVWLKRGMSWHRDG